MLITVAICTWNRAALLRQTLEHMKQLRAPVGSTWELLVVDNNSSDDTEHVISEFERRLPLRRLWEPRPGLSNARNTAVAAARGSFIVWTDDDVLVDRDWLVAYSEAFQNFPDAVVFGGPILPWFSSPPPKWLARGFAHVEPAYAVRNFNCDDAQLGGDIVPFGANMAFRTDILTEHPFDQSLGRVGTAMLGGEEEVIIRALLLEGKQGRWVTAARVRHYIAGDRQSTRYLRRFYEGVGATAARISSTTGVNLWFGRPPWVWRERITTSLMFGLHRMFAPAPVWVRSLKRASVARGRFSSFAKR